MRCDNTGFRPGRIENMAAVSERKPAAIGKPNVLETAEPSPDAIPTIRQMAMKKLCIANTAARALKSDLVSTPAPEDAFQARDITFP